METTPYRERLIDNNIANRLTNSTGAILISGMRWTGKTTTGEHHCRSSFSLADSSNNFSNRRLALASPDHVLKGEQPRLLDEWQLVPALWDAVKYACDTQAGFGHYILTGSSLQTIANKAEIYHSGTGRITEITLSTMTLFETGDSDGSVSLRSLFDAAPENRLVKRLDFESLVRFCIRGGWPKSVDVPLNFAGDTPVDYINRIITDDFNDLPSVKNRRPPEKISSVLSAIANFDSTTAGTTEYSKYIRDNFAFTMSRPTLDSYLEGFKALFIIEKERAFPVPESVGGARLRKTPKTRYADPSLAIAALGYKPHNLLNNIDLFAKYFDSLCYHDLKIYAQSMDADIFYLMEEHGSSADSIIQLGGSDGRIGCFKHVVSESDADAAASELFRVKRILENAGIHPSFLCVICGIASSVSVRQDGVIVLPLTVLKP